MKNKNRTPGPGLGWKEEKIFGDLVLLFTRGPGKTTVNPSLIPSFFNLHSSQVFQRLYKVRQSIPPRNLLYLYRTRSISDTSGQNLLWYLFYENQPSCPMERLMEFSILLEVYLGRTEQPSTLVIEKWGRRSTV